ncbi:Histidine kinase family [Verrucomicrobiia bacterium DG1235]|nr:Histidine kinase family [Verrucomicrobiae bacterium DG1235]
MSATSSAAHRTSTLYWILQLLGWLAYGTIGYATNIRFNPGVTHLKVAALAYSGSALLFLLTHLLRRHSLRHHWVQLSFDKLILRLAVSTFLISTLSQLIISALMFWPIDVITPEQPYSLGYLVIYILQTQIILLLWSLVYFSYHAIRNYKNEEIEKWRLQAAVKDAELIALKAQINPHFIFNCLNNIRALVLEDAEKARDAITKLSDLLRYSIQSNQAEKITIAEELFTVRDYLDLETIHMESRLQHSITVDPVAEEFEIPPMAIQLLVENAIKHSLAKLPTGGRIDIAITSEPTSIRIQVLNTGQLAPAADPTSTSIGLKNIRDRLHLLSGPTATLTLENHTPTQVLAQITLPRHP